MKMLSKFFVLVIGPVVALVSGCASVPPYGVIDGKIVIDSPFALQIGSTEYAEPFGRLVQSSVFAIYNPETKATETNFSHYARACLKEPYFGYSQAHLSFEGEEKVLDGVSLRGFGEKFSSYLECRERVREVVKDIERRLGSYMACTCENSEEEVKTGIQRLAEDKKNGRSRGISAMSFLSYEGWGRGKGCEVVYHVSGMYDSKGSFSVDVSCRRPRGFEVRRRANESGSRIPVYTNKVNASGKEAEERQMKAHAAAAKLREVLKRTLSTDFDETNTASCVASGSSGPLKWKPLEPAFEGATERRDHMQTFGRIPYRLLSIRRAYAGDVGAEGLEVQSWRFLDRLERELGMKLEPREKASGLEQKKNLTVNGATDAPAFGDFVGHEMRMFFSGRVGDVSVEIFYRSPRYRKSGDSYVITSRAAVIMNFIQDSNAN